jgi:hypothetical protein
MAWAPSPPRSCTTLPALLEGDLPALPVCSTSVTRHRDTNTSRASSTCMEPHWLKQAASTPSTAVEPHAPAATATDEDAAEALRGEVAGAGDSDHADAPMERALVDGRLHAIETTRNRWCAPAVEVDLPLGLASMSAIRFSWRSDLLLVASVGDTCFVAAAFAPWRTGAAARQRRWRPRRGRGAGTTTKSLWSVDCKVLFS